MATVRLSPASERASSRHTARRAVADAGGVLVEGVQGQTVGADEEAGRCQRHREARRGGRSDGDSRRHRGRDAVGAGVLPVPEHAATSAPSTTKAGMNDLSIETPFTNTAYECDCANLCNSERNCAIDLGLRPWSEFTEALRVAVRCAHASGHWTASARGGRRLVNRTGARHRGWSSISVRDPVPQCCAARRRNRIRSSLVSMPMRARWRMRHVRAGRPTRKGGRDNVIFVAAAAEELPAQLRGMADESTVILPWGSLLLAVLEPGKAAFEGIAATLRPGGELQCSSLPSHVTRSMTALS